MRKRLNIFPSPGEKPPLLVWWCWLARNNHQWIPTTSEFSSLSPPLIVAQLLSHVPLFVTSLTAACQAPLSSPVSRSLLKLMSNEPVMLFNHHIFCHPLLLLPSIFSSRVFANESALRIRLPKYWSFSFSIRPSNEYSGFISFRMDWFDLLAVQGTLKSLLPHYN